LNAKVELRAGMRALRKRLSEASPDAANRAAAFAPHLPTGQIVALYRAVGAEFDPEPLSHALIAAGRSLCLPVAIERDAPLVFRRWSPGEPLEMDVAGCPAPLPLAEVVIPDLIIAPLLAFDSAGSRLGQGGGYYDRTFAALPDAVRVGLAYEGQRVEDLPILPHDIALHGVLTEVGYTPTRKV
jgi:5-formyltetrahydrofolate cyclo-ligase